MYFYEKENNEIVAFTEGWELKGPIMVDIVSHVEHQDVSDDNRKWVDMSSYTEFFVTMSLTHVTLEIDVFTTNCWDQPKTMGLNKF